jgi:transposase-like protein
MRTVRTMGGSKPKNGNKSPRQWSAEEKLRIVLEAAALSDAELGEFLRRNGLHTAQLEDWRGLVTEAAQAALAGPKRRAKKSPEARRIKELEKELRRKEKALAEVAALLALKKKAQEIWGDADDDTPTTNGT